MTPRTPSRRALQPACGVLHDALALVALASALDRRRVDVTIVDGRLEADPVRRVLAATEGAAVFGTTVLTGAPIRDALTVTRAVKAARPGYATVWGLASVALPRRLPRRTGRRCGGDRAGRAHLRGAR
ncbi:MAG: hypothetical protein R2712_21325 [Vicinamibacterales bacterium]